MKICFTKSMPLLAVVPAIALLAIALIAASPPGIARVSDTEGARICGGQSGCANYGQQFVFCGSAQCQGMTQTCPTQNKLVSGNTVTAKNVSQKTDGACSTCGNYCGQNLAITTWSPCVTATTQ